MLRSFITSLLISSVLASSKHFNYSCVLQRPLHDSTLPTISLNSLELQVSHRVTHQLVTRIFAILLKDILEFDKISISNDIDILPTLLPDEKTVEYAILNTLAGKPEPAINLEVWVPPDSHISFPDNILQGGSLSNDLARYGLFIKESPGARLYTYQDFISSSSSYYEAIKDFKINKEMENILLKNVESTKDFNGVFQPPQCFSASEPCAAVLTSYYDDTKFFIEHINSLKLKLTVYFLGENLPKAIGLLNSIVNFNLNNKTRRNVPTKYLVLHWTPSEIVNGSINYKPVTMPSCELYKNKKNSCRYDIIPVSIYFNKEVKESDDLMEIIKVLHFPSLKSVIDVYGSYVQDIDKIYMQIKANEETTESVEDYYNEIACKWLQQNPNFYDLSHEDSWIKKPYERREISIGGIFPLYDSGREYQGISTAIEMAENMVNNNPDILPGYSLVVKRVHSDCKPDLVLRHFINYYSHRKHLVGVLGPSCSEAIEPIAGISKHFKMSVITYSAEGISLDDREQYPYFYRTIGETKQHEDVYVKLLTELNWKRLAALTEDGMKYTQYITDMESKLRDNHIDLIVNKKFARESNKEKQLENFKTSLKELKEIHRAKIIIADVHDHTLMKLIMCAASKMKMTAQSGYVWFLPVYVTMKINDTGLQDVNGSCTESEIKSALAGHFSLSYAPFADDSDVIEGNQTVEEWKQLYLQGTGMNKTSFSDYAGYAYDAIWVYAKSLQQLIKEDSPKHRYLRNLYSDETMEKLADLINNMNFQGVSGRIQFSRGGSRFTDINILQWQKNDYALVGTYKPKISNRTNVGGVLRLNSRVSWVNGEQPSDGRESCALKSIADAFNIDCHTIHTLIVILLCVSLVLVCSASSFFFWKRKYDKKLVESEKFLGNYRTILNGSELTKWEIQRENIVINRRLGEGAFGTVYGGEALIDENEGWTAVAIKTLKSGSNAENRLDFLAESETMKRFDHKNIVKLLAVCLQSEPLYAVMEFMLYGDLKTYLLARRHLVNEKITDDSDVSPKRLTLMALDVSRGLSYLASMNYVHRDVACRNCMINAQRIVKIGDFGMARPTFESDYYRFVRKGMLPVRWMAPESIDGGIFSHASDMWSYGVLLYEIVTLGAFPFQGMSNPEVYEHVKSGNSIKIPMTCKPQLRALMSSCFSFDPKKRPGASTIVEFISNYPRMLTHCMDVPKPCLDYQVNLIDGDHDQLERFEQLMDHRDRSHTPAASLDFLKTSASSSALQNNLGNHHEDPSSFEYLDMQLTRKPNGIYLNDFHPDLTASLPNGNYNPVEPLLQARQEISKSNLSLMKYMPMCGFSKNSNRSSPEECTSAM